MWFREKQCMWKTQNAEHIGADQCVLDAGHSGSHTWPVLSGTDCREEDGITVGLIDSLMAISKVLAPRLAGMDQNHAIAEALADLRSDSFLLSVFSKMD